MAVWDNSIYHITAENGKKVIIDVTQSVNPALGPNKAIKKVIEFFKRKEVETVLDYGAGALRHTFPLLKAGFQVCAVDFEEQYADTDSKRICKIMKEKAEDDPNFSELVYPRPFIKDNRKFDAALLCYTFQSMPLQKERMHALRLLYKKLKKRSFIIWMSRYGDAKNLPDSRCVEDGYFKSPKPPHSFYMEIKTEDIHDMFQTVGWRKSFHRLRSLGCGGRDQIFAYSKKKREAWI